MSVTGNIDAISSFPVRKVTKNAPADAKTLDRNSLDYEPSFSSFLLPKEIIFCDHIFDFVDVGAYLYVAGTSCKFHELYSQFVKQHREKQEEQASAPIRLLTQQQPLRAY